MIETHLFYFLCIAREPTIETIITAVYFRFLFVIFDGYLFLLKIIIPGSRIQCSCALLSLVAMQYSAHSSC